MACMENAKKILREHSAVLQSLAETLIERESLSALEIEEITGISQPLSRMMNT